MGRIATALAGALNPASTKRYVTSPRNVNEAALASLVVSPNGRQGKPSAGLYRNWAQNSDLGRALVNFFKRQVSVAEWDIVPYRSDKPSDAVLAARIRDLFEDPAATVEGFQGFIEMVAEDLLVLDAGCVELERTFRRKIAYLHPADGARVLVSTTWDGGDPNEPRYYWMKTTTELVPMRNDALLYMMTNPRTYSPVGLSMFETLKMTIDWELKSSSYNAKQVTTATPDGVLDLGEGAKPEQVEFFRCYADDTEFLTERGWLPFDAITPGDLLATVDDAGEMHFAAPTDRYEAPYSGQMVKFGGRLDLLVTPNHRMVVSDRHGDNLRFVDAADMVGRDYTVPVAPAAWNCLDMPTFTLPQQEWQPGQGARVLKRTEPIRIEDWLEFLGYVVSDGYVSEVGWGADHYCVGLAQNEGPKAERIQACLDRLPFRANRTHARGKAMWRIWDKSLWTWAQANIGQGARRKRLPRDLMALNRERLTVLFDALMFGDGHTKPNGWRKYTTVSRDLADNVQEIALKLGFRAVIAASPAGLYDVLVPPRRTARVTPTTAQFVDWSGRIVCFTVPTGRLVVRRGGKPAICGNSMWQAEVSGQGALAILGGTKGAKYMPFRAGNREMQFMEWQAYLLKKACMVAGVSPQDLGFAMDINRAEGQVQQEISETKGLRPFMATVQNYLTSRVVWDESFGGRANNLAFRFNNLNIRESTDKANINKVALAGVPWKTQKEARLDEGRQPLGGDMEDQILANTPLGIFNFATGKYIVPEQPLTGAGDAGPADQG